jgi:hypothetical protein
VILMTAERFQRLREQRERLVSPVGEDVGGSECCSEVRCGENLPGPADVEAALEVPGRTREITATEVGEAET